MSAPHAVTMQWTTDTPKGSVTLTMEIALPRPPANQEERVQLRNLMVATMSAASDTYNGWIDHETAKKGS
jgi:hypothetical protein